MDNSGQLPIRVSKVRGLVKPAHPGQGKILGTLARRLPTLSTGTEDEHDSKGVSLSPYCMHLNATLQYLDRNREHNLEPGGTSSFSRDSYNQNFFLNKRAQRRELFGIHDLKKKLVKCLMVWYIQIYSGVRT